MAERGELERSEVELIYNLKYNVCACVFPAKSLVWACYDSLINLLA